MCSRTVMDNETLQISTVLVVDYKTRENTFSVGQHRLRYDLLPHQVRYTATAATVIGEYCEQFVNHS